MTTETLERFFVKMGARVKFGEHLRSRWANRDGLVEDLALDVRNDKDGEYFSVLRNSDSPTELLVLNVEPKDRHLLLLSRNGLVKHRYLLGHDERHWFVAGIPERTPVSTVRDAKQALKPDVVIARETRVRAQHRDLRHNAARIRQGEWFFVPVDGFIPVDRRSILRNEPLRRGGGKPHRCDELYRSGGETVYVSTGAPNGLTQQQYRALSDYERKRWKWTVMQRNAAVYVRGRVRHRDHKTIMLNGWHEVYMNTEGLSHGMRNVAFLD